MKTALILGCSHVAGSEMHLEPGLDLAGVNPQVYGLYNNYATVVAKTLGYYPVNHAIPGGSNDAMFRIWEDYINPYSNRIRPDLVIACWTGGNRTEIWDEDHDQWQPLAPGKQTFYATVPNAMIPNGEYVPERIDNEQELLDYQRQWVIYQSNAHASRLNKIKNILALNAMAQVEQIPVINLDSFDSVQGIRYPEWVFRPMKQHEFCNWAVGAGFQHTDSGHFFSDAHKMYAQLVVSKLPQKLYD